MNKTSTTTLKKRRCRWLQRKKVELRKFYDNQVNEKNEKKRREREMQKKYAEEQAKELDLWHKSCDVSTTKKKALDEKAWRDEQILLNKNQKLKFLEQEVQHHVALMERLAKEEEKNKKALEDKAAQQAEFLQTTRSQAQASYSNKKNFWSGQRVEEAEKMNLHEEQFKKYEQQQKEDAIVKKEKVRQESEQIRKERAAARTSSRQAAAKLDMEEVQARQKALEKQEQERVAKAKELRERTYEYIRQQMTEQKEQKNKELEDLKAPPKPVPNDAGCSLPKKLVARDLTTAHAWDFARSEAELKAKDREQRLKHRKELEAQISARGRPFPGLNIRSRKTRVEPQLSPTEMLFNRKLVEEVSSPTT